MELEKEDYEKIQKFMEAQKKDSKIGQFTSEAILEAVRKELKKFPQTDPAGVV